MALALTACGSKGGDKKSSAAATGTAAASAPAGGATSSAAAGKSLTACMVLDTGGVDDKSFNQSSWAGMQTANKANPNIKISYVPSNSGNDYTPNLEGRGQRRAARRSSRSAA